MSQVSSQGSGAQEKKSTKTILSPSFSTAPAASSREVGPMTPSNFVIRAFTDFGMPKWWITRSNRWQEITNIAPPMSSGCFMWLVSASSCEQPPCARTCITLPWRPLLSPSCIASTAGEKRQQLPTCSMPSWRCTASTILRASAELRPAGFLHSTALPAFRGSQDRSAILFLLEGVEKGLQQGTVVPGAHHPGVGQPLNGAHAPGSVRVGDAQTRHAQCGVGSDDLAHSASPCEMC